MRRRCQRTAAGFTLLEVMLAVAILAATLVVLLRIVTNNIRATNHAKLTIAATFLARTKMSDVEDDVLYNGFSTETETDKGNFKDEGYPAFSWETMIERIELPTDLTSKAQDTATKSSQDAKNPMEMMSSFLGGMMSAFIEPIRIGLQESVRKVTVRVIWDEHGRPDQTIEVVEYLTDPSQLEKTMGMAAAAAAGQTPGGQQQQGSKAPQTGQAAGAVQQRTPFPGFTGNMLNK
jgi:prepilin-type N-terminal cleavage/methylation domain-containing protein